MDYWTATDEYKRTHRRGPICQFCGQEMFPQDDHGRYTCLCNLGSGIDVRTGKQFHAPIIPQVDTSGMPDGEKAEIAPINRLKSEPTAAETKVLSMLLRGPEAMSDPEYDAARRALEKERAK